MSFFAKKPADSDVAAPPVQPAAPAPAATPESEAARAAKPINWEDLVNTPESEQAAAVPEASTTPVPPEEKLADVDDETRAILEQAAKDMEKKIRGDGNDGGDAS